MSRLLPAFAWSESSLRRLGRFKSHRLMVAGILLASCLMSPSMARAQAPPPSTPSVQTGFLSRSLVVAGFEYRYAVYVPRGYQASVHWPVILALHGSDDFGSDGRKQLNGGLAPKIRTYPERFPAIVVFPQSHIEGMWGWHARDGEAAMAELDKTMSEFSIDPRRVYLTGVSAGGNGAWFLAVKYPERFAAVAVVSGFVSEDRGSRLPSIAPPGTADLDAYVAKRVASIPIWISHGSVDPVVPVEESRRMYAALKAAGAKVQYTEFPGVGHNAWDWDYEQPPMITWMLKQAKKQ